MTAVRSCSGRDARAGNDQIALLDHGLGAVGIDAGQRDQRQNLVFGLQNIDRRLPGRLPLLAGPRAKQLAVHAFGPRQHFAGFGPHPIAGQSFTGHGTSPPAIG